MKTKLTDEGINQRVARMKWNDSWLHLCPETFLVWCNLASGLLPAWFRTVRVEEGSPPQDGVQLFFRYVQVRKTVVRACLYSLILTLPLLASFLLVLWSVAKSTPTFSAFPQKQPVSFWVGVMGICGCVGIVILMYKKVKKCGHESELLGNAINAHGHKVSEFCRLFWINSSEQVVRMNTQGLVGWVKKELMLQTIRVLELEKSEARKCGSAASLEKVRDHLKSMLEVARDLRVCFISRKHLFAEAEAQVWCFEI